MISSIEEPPIDDAMIRHDLLDFTEIVVAFNDPSVKFIQKYAEECQFKFNSRTPSVGLALCSAGLVFWKDYEERIRKCIFDMNRHRVPVYIDFLEEKTTSLFSPWIGEQERKFVSAHKALMPGFVERK